MRTLIVASFAVLLFLPATTLAQFGPIVPEICRQCACGFGGVLAIIQNGINFIISISIIIATIIIAWAGGLYMISSTNPESRSTANKMLINAAVGLVIVLSAWLVVDFVMKTLYGGQFGPWNSILVKGTGDSCVEAKETPPLFDGNIVTVPVPPGGGTSGGVTGTPGCPSCVSLTEKGLSCKSASSCTLDSTVANRVVALKNNFSGQWTVTEAYPPTYTHSNQCHANGTCIDAGFRGSTTYSAANIAEFATAARLAGLRAVFETDSCALRDTARARGVTAFCKTDSGYSHITGNHFSLYSN